MATGREVLNKLCPEGGWVITESDFDSIIWTDDRPRCTKAEFESAFEQLKKDEMSEVENKAKAKAALLDKLGISSEEAALLLS